MQRSRRQQLPGVPCSGQGGSSSPEYHAADKAAAALRSTMQRTRRQQLPSLVGEGSGVGSVIIQQHHIQKYPQEPPFLCPKNVALLAPALTFVEIYLAPLPFSLTFVEICLAPLAPPLTLVVFYPAPLPRPQCPTRQRRSTAPQHQPAKTAYLYSRNCINMHFSPRGLPFSKRRPHF